MEWTNHDLESIESIKDPDARETLLFVRDAADRIAAMGGQKGPAALVSLVATLCSWTEDPSGALDQMTEAVRQRIAMDGAVGRG